MISVLRWILVYTNVLNSNKEKEEQATAIIIGSAEEYQQTQHLLKEAGIQQKVLGRVAVEENDFNSLGNWKNLHQLSSAIPFRQIIYCRGILSFADIINSIQQLPTGLTVKIHSSGSSSIVGSDSKDSSGEALSKENGYKLADPYYRRLKRLIDVSVALLGIITFPVHLFLIKNPFRFFANCLSILLAKKTWIGYAINEKNLPPLKSSVVACNGIMSSIKQQLPADSLYMIDYWYARDYEPVSDLKLIGRVYRKLGG
jgi:hypothetical protein